MWGGLDYLWIWTTVENLHGHHSVFCLTTGSKRPPKWFLHIVRSRASSFKWEYPLLSLRSSSSFLRFLPRLLVTSISPFIFPSITCFRRFLRTLAYNYNYLYRSNNSPADILPSTDISITLDYFTLHDPYHSSVYGICTLNNEAISPSIIQEGKVLISFLQAVEVINISCWVISYVEWLAEGSPIAAVSC